MIRVTVVSLLSGICFNATCVSLTFLQVLQALPRVFCAKEERFQVQPVRLDNFQ